MEWIIATFGIVACAFGTGYLIGYRHCFDYLMTEVKRQQKEKK